MFARPVSNKGSVLLYCLFLSAFLAAFFAAFRMDLKNLMSDGETNAKVARSASAMRSLLLESAFDHQVSLSAVDPYYLVPVGYDGRYFKRRVTVGNPLVFTVSKPPAPLADFETYVAFGSPVRIRTYNAAGLLVNEASSSLGEEKVVSTPPYQGRIEIDSLGGISDVEVERRGSTLSESTFSLSVLKAAGPTKTDLWTYRPNELR